MKQQNLINSSFWYTKESSLSGFEIPITEKRNINSLFIDRMPAKDIINTFIEEDKLIPHAISKVADKIAQAVDLLVKTFKEGGRFIYIGAGSSGRLGALDAAELPPTFGIESDRAIAVIAGGDEALKKAVEGAEDNESQAIVDLQNISFSKNDILIAISASGLTPYVRSAINYANNIKSKVILITCNPDGPFPKVDVLINPVVGPEIIAGSTRLKAGTACKIVLNILSSTAMILCGKVYQNYMVDLVPTNKKLKNRAIRILSEVTNISYQKAYQLLSENNWNLKVCILMVKKGYTYTQAVDALDKANGVLYKALNEEPM